jgi:hypothetical protein
MLNAMPTVKLRAIIASVLVLGSMAPDAAVLA